MTFILELGGAAAGTLVLLGLWRVTRRGADLHRRQKRLAEERAGEDYPTFERLAAGGNLPPMLLKNTYALLSCEVALVPNFPVHPSDSLHEVFGIGGASGTDLDDIVDALLTRCGLTVIKPCRGAESVETVADLLYWLESVTQGCP